MSGLPLWAIALAAALFNLGPVPITQAVVATWAIMAVLAGGAWLVTRRLTLDASAAQAAFELVVETVDGQVRDTTSVSRVGGKTQARALRDAAQTLRLDYAQFLELETFTRFGGMSDARVRDQLTRGARIRTILNQPQHAPMRLADEVALVLAVQSGLLDALPLPAMAGFRSGLAAALDQAAPGPVGMVQDTGTLDEAGKQALLAVLRDHVQGAMPPAALAVTPGATPAVTPAVAP